MPGTRNPELENPLSLLNLSPPAGKSRYQSWYVANVMAPVPDLGRLHQATQAKQRKAKHWDSGTAGREAFVMHHWKRL